MPYCVVTVADSGVDYHHDDITMARADIGAMVAQINESTALWGRQAEACGYFMVGERDGEDMHTFALENVDAMKGGTFALHDDDCLLLAELIEQGKLLGLWHSHPNGRRNPSDEDWAGHPRSVPMYIVSCEGEGEYVIMRYTDEDRPGRPVFDD